MHQALRESRKRFSYKNKLQLVKKYLTSVQMETKDFASLKVVELKERLEVCTEIDLWKLGI